MLDLASGENISIHYFASGSDLLSTTTNSGCYIHCLTATNANGEFVDFWKGKLGFEVGDLVPPVTDVNKNYASISPDAIIMPTLDFTVGKNLVTGFGGLDTVVKKGGSWFEPPVTASLPIDSTINDTLGILANEAFERIILGSSHFLLELNSTFVNNFVSESVIKSNIQAIISRYYGYDQYTSSEGQGSITYIHKGDPVYIKNMSCRILNPDLTLASLGNKNHIYLQLIKPSTPINKNDKTTATHQLNK